MTLTLPHSERPKLYTILAFLSAIGLPALESEQMLVGHYGYKPLSPIPSSTTGPSRSASFLFHALLIFFHLYPLSSRCVKGYIQDDYQKQDHTGLKYGNS